MMKTRCLTRSLQGLELAVGVGRVLRLRLWLRPFPSISPAFCGWVCCFAFSAPFLPKAASPLPAIPAPVIPLSSALTGSLSSAPAAGSF